MSLPKQMSIEILGNTVMIDAFNEFSFTYTPAEGLVKEEFKNDYTWVGGLQCNELDPIEYKKLEKKLAKIARKILKALKRD